MLEQKRMERYDLAIIFVSAKTFAWQNSYINISHVTLMVADRWIFEFAIGYC